MNTQLELEAFVKSPFLILMGNPKRTHNKLEFLSLLHELERNFLSASLVPETLIAKFSVKKRPFKKC